MEQILPAMEEQLRRLRRNAAALAEAYPRLAQRPGSAPDAHVDRLVQGVAALHARSALALDRARRRQDEHLLELHFPGQLRPFPECTIGPAPGAASVAAIVAARYRAGPDGAIELELELGRPGRADAPALDIFLDGDAAFCAVLRSALLGCGAGWAGGAGGAESCAGAAVRVGSDAGWRCLPRWPITSCGLDPAEGLLPRPAGAHAGLALLREYLTFPARFNLLRLDLAQFGAAGRWSLRLPTPGADTPAARLLEALQAGHLRAGWTARACLQPAAATPLRLDGRRHEYLLSVPAGMEIFSIDRVRVQGAGEHGWFAHRVDDAPPGHEWRIAFRREIAWQTGAAASIDVTCCEREAVLGRPARGDGCRWQLNSLLALDHLPPEAGALRELMATQALVDCAATRAIINAVRGLDCLPALLRPGRAAPLQGTEWRLYVDAAAFEGGGLTLFAQVMDRFFGECAHLNTFTRLVLAAANTGEELIRCKARNAATLLE